MSNKIGDGMRSNAVGPAIRSKTLLILALGFVFTSSAAPLLAGTSVMSCSALADTENFISDPFKTNEDPSVVLQRFLAWLDTNHPSGIGSWTSMNEQNSRRGCYISEKTLEEEISENNNHDPNDRLNVYVGWKPPAERDSVVAANTARERASTTQNVRGATAYEAGLNSCVHIRRSNDGAAETYIENACNRDAYVVVFQPGPGVGGSYCNAGEHCAISIIGIGFTGRGMVSAACPKGDYVESSSGVQWSGVGGFRCRKP
jgi:hypothetical protein